MRNRKEIIVDGKAQSQHVLGDVGAIFACVAAGQAISGFATPLYNKIYVAVRIMRMVMIMTKPNITMFCMLDFKYATIKHSYGDTPLQQNICRGEDGDEDNDDNDKTTYYHVLDVGC